LACALGHKACRDGFSGFYRRAPRLFVDLATARGEGRLARLMKNLERTRLLIVDDWGPEPLNAEQRGTCWRSLRTVKGRVRFTSQVPVAAGPTSLRIQLWVMRSWTASFTERIGSS